MQSGTKPERCRWPEAKGTAGATGRVAMLAETAAAHHGRLTTDVYPPGAGQQTFPPEIRLQPSVLGPSRERCRMETIIRNA